MLPITNHRVLHIPHGLAIGAAIVGLIVALSWDRPQATDRAAVAPPPPMITIEDDRDDAADKHVPGPGREDPRGREMLPGFGPLVLPFSPGRR